MKLFIASDHAGFALKQRIIAHLHATFSHISVTDLGTHNAAISVDYPDYGFKVANSITADALGIVICGSGIGISIAANRVAGVRCALCTSAEMAQLAREHNDANVLALGARIISEEVALACVDIFLSTQFAGGRHTHRITKLETKK